MNTNSKFQCRNFDDLYFFVALFSFILCSECRAEGTEAKKWNCPRVGGVITCGNSWKNVKLAVFELDIVHANGFSVARVKIESILSAPDTHTHFAYDVNGTVWSVVVAGNGCCEILDLLNMNKPHSKVVCKRAVH